MPDFIENNLFLITVIIIAFALIVFVIVLKAPLTRLIDRSNYKKQDGGFNTAPDQSQKEDGAKQTAEKMNIYHSSVLKEREKNIKDEIDAIEHLDTDGKINLLVNYLSNAYLVTRFEQLYYLIFRSQIQLLRTLNSYRGEKGWAKEDMESHCLQVISTFPGIAGWSAEQYLDFLLFTFLIRVENNSYYITDFGIDFLTWLVKEGKNEDKGN